MEQRWRAAWVNTQGKHREFVFDSLSSRMIARIDFKLKLSFATGFEGERVPEQYELEEVTHDRRATLLRW